MTYCIVASDLDGTLLDDKSDITPFTKQVLNALIEKGIKFVFATGRHHCDVNRIKEKIGIDAYMITSNGARVHNEQGELIFSHSIREDIAADIVRIAKESADIVTHVYRGDHWYCDRISEDVIYFSRVSGFDYQLFDEKGFDFSDVAKIYYTVDDLDKIPLLRQLELELEKRWGADLSITFSSENCLEIMAGGVSKGVALKQVVEEWGNTLTDCIAFGDGMNDEAMLSMVGKGVMMENASSRLKAALPNIELIGKNSEEAVPAHLHKLYLLQDD